MNKELLQKFNLEKAKELMVEGKTQAEIGKEFGISAQRISDLFKYYNIPYIKRSLKINDTYFDIIDTEDKAYLLGFLVADGCVREEIRRTKTTYRIAFNNTIADKEAIELLHSNICPEQKLNICNNHYNRRKQPTYILQWTSEHMAKVLKEKYHIKPRKTYDSTFSIPEESIPEPLWRHFIRGFFDGDGHIGANSLEFVFNSEPFMNQIMGWFKNFNYRVIKVNGKTTIYWKVIIPLDDIERKAIKDFFYKDSKYYLKRKYNSFNTEISYNITNRVIEIVEHSAE